MRSGRWSRTIGEPAWGSGRQDAGIGEWDGECGGKRWNGDGRADARSSRQPMGSRRIARTGRYSRRHEVTGAIIEPNADNAPGEGFAQDQIEIVVVIQVRDDRGGRETAWEKRQLAATPPEQFDVASRLERNAGEIGSLVSIEVRHSPGGGAVRIKGRARSRVRRKRGDDRQNQEEQRAHELLFYQCD